MTAPSTPRHRPATLRLAGIGILAAAVVAVLVVIGRVHTVNPAFSLFGRQYAAATTLKAVLATVVLGVAALQVLLALWIYRKLPLAGSPPRPVRLAHRVVGFALFALTVPIALHCLIVYGVQFYSVRVAVHSLARVLFLRRVRREGAARAHKAAARLGAAGGGRHARGCRRRAVVHLGAVVLQRRRLAALLACFRAGSRHPGPPGETGRPGGPMR